MYRNYRMTDKLIDILNLNQSDGAFTLKVLKSLKW